MKQQTILNSVAAHLLKQGKKSYENGMCRYHSAEGECCAVGCLIADAEYDWRMEGNLVTRIADMLPSRLRAHLELLRSLQIIHDDFPVEEWTRQLRKLAVRLKLKVPKGCE